MVLKGNTMNYISGSQLVLGSGFFASSPAQLKSIRASDGVTLTDANGALTLSASAPPYPWAPLDYNINGQLVIEYGWGLTLNNGQLIVDNGAVEQVM